MNLSDAFQLRLNELDSNVWSVMISTTRYEANVAILIRDKIPGITSGMATILLVNPLSWPALFLLKTAQDQTVIPTKIETEGTQIVT